MRHWMDHFARLPIPKRESPPRPVSPSGSRSGSPLLLALLILSALLQVTCTRYEYLVEEVYEQVRYSNQIDLVFVFDNSQSMVEEQQALSENAARFVQSISAAALQEQSFPKETLTDAVSNYLFFVNNFSRFVNFRIAVTSTQVEVDPYSEAPLEPGVDGLFYPPFPEDPSQPPFLGLDSPDVVARFSDVLTDISLTPLGGQEKGLDAIRRAICLALPDPSVLDRADDSLDCSDVRPEEVGINGDFLREDVALVAIVITDEGDASQAPVANYLDFLDRVGKPYSLSAIAPFLGDDLATSCNPESAPSTSIERYAEATDSSGGLHIPVCSDFAQALDDVSRLINTLLMRFRLRQVPQLDSLLVFVNGVQVPQSLENGWEYVPGTNSLEFHGSAVPDYNARIDVYYRAVAAVDPRPLPF